MFCVFFFFSFLSLVSSPFTAFPSLPASLLFLPPDSMILSLKASVVAGTHHTRTPTPCFADSFATAHSVPPGDAVKFVPTPLGGTLLSFLTLVTFAVLLVIKYAEANVLTQSSLAVLTTALSASAASLPWAAALAPVGSALAGASGVQVRIFAQGGLGDCATPIGLTSTWPDAGAWSWTFTPSCGAGDPRSVLTLSCEDCDFTADSAVSFSLPWSCQALYLEALSVNALRGVNTIVFPPDSSTATEASGLLTSLSWQLQPMLAVVTDFTGSGADARGYQLLPGPTSVARTVPGAVLLPLAAAVRVSIKLPLEATYSLTQLTPLTSPTSLLSSIIGLAGLLSVFRVLFSLTEVALARPSALRRLARCCAAARVRAPSRSKLVAAPPAAVTASSEGRIGAASLGDAWPEQQCCSGQASLPTVNPLLLVRGGSVTSEADNITSDNVRSDCNGSVVDEWVQRSDDTGDVWYEHKQTGETAWDLPVTVPGPKRFADSESGCVALSLSKP